MSEYDMALDCQADWASFWSSDAGNLMYVAIWEAVTEQREKAGERFTDDLAMRHSDELALLNTALLNGESYYWSSAMLDIIQEAARSIPTTWSLAREHLSSVSGFFYFSKEVKPGLKAISWNVATSNQDEEPDPERGQITVIHLPDESQGMPPDFNAVLLMSFLSNPVSGRPLPTITSWYVGESLQDWKIAAAKRAIRINADPSSFDLDYESLKLFAAMLSFLQQRIMVPTRVSVSRPAFKRIARTERMTESVVNVIKLRSIIRHSTAGEGEPVDWQCRWIVRGHWRDQWYPSLGKHQPIFISPFIKGPEDKPLKDAKKLFAVVR